EPAAAEPAFGGLSCPWDPRAPARPSRARRQQRALPHTTRVKRRARTASGLQRASRVLQGGRPSTSSSRTRTCRPARAPRTARPPRRRRVELGNERGREVVPPPGGAVAVELGEP